MKKRKTLFLLFILPGMICAQSSFSDSYKPGDKLYVYSGDGLACRQQPDPKGKVIDVMAYGDEVIVLPESRERITYISSNISGAWVRIKRNATEGYMFNGFLSRLKPMTITIPGKSEEEFRNYLIKEFKLSKETKTAPEKIYIEYSKIELANGVVQESKIYAGGVTTITSFPVQSFTFQEVFLIVKIAYPEFFKERNCGYNSDHVLCTLEELSSLEIKKEGRFIMVISGSAD